MIWFGLGFFIGGTFAAALAAAAGRSDRYMDGFRDGLNFAPKAPGTELTWPERDDE